MFLSASWLCEFGGWDQWNLHLSAEATECRFETKLFAEGERRAARVLFHVQGHCAFAFRVNLCQFVGPLSEMKLNWPQPRLSHAA